MSHHSSEPFDEGQRKIGEMMQALKDTSAFRGAIGAYPEGKLHPSDEGNIQFGVGQRDGKVVIDFGTPVAWIGMTAQQATDLASLIFKQARQTAREKGETVEVRIV